MVKIGAVPSIVKESTHLEPTLESFRREIATSGHLVRLIDVLYALGLAQGAVTYRSIFGTPSDMSVQVVLALVLVYYTIARSFIDWHIAMESGPYRIMRADHRTSELRRVYVDFAIVALYAFMLFKAHPLLESPDAGLRLFFWAFPMLFALYLLWGRLRRHAHGSQQFSPALLLLFLVLWLVLAVAYEIVFESCDLDHRTVNAIALGLALLLMACYRHFNWQQQEVIDSS